MTASREWTRSGSVGAGGDWKGVPPRVDNPMSWSLPLFRLSGIDVRIHLIFLAVIVIELGIVLDILILSCKVDHYSGEVFIPPSNSQQCI